MKTETSSPAVRVGVTMTTGFAATLGMFLAIVAAIFIVVAMATAWFGEVTGSVWQTAAAGAFKYFPMAIAVMITVVMLPIYVAQGVTRRQAAAGISLFVAAWSLLLALAVVIGFAAEAGAFAAFGWPHKFDAPHLFSSWTQIHLVVGEYFTLIAVHMMAGWLIGTTYYILGWFRATLLLPATVSPILVVEGLLATSWVGAGIEHFGTFTPPQVGIALPASAAVIAAAWLINYLLIRDMPIKLSAA